MNGNLTHDKKPSMGIAGERTFQIEGTECAKGPKAENCYFWETDNKPVVCLECSQPECLDWSYSGFLKIMFSMHWRLWKNKNQGNKKVVFFFQKAHTLFCI